MPKVLHDALTALFVRTVTKRGRYADGNGLYLLVDASGNRRWVLRTVIKGKRNDMGLGSTTTRSLKDARAKAAEYRGAARDGRDPIAERRQDKAVPTFKEVAELWHASHATEWRNPKHREQWINTLKEYAFPHMGGKRVSEIESADVLRALSPIWTTKPETARRVLQRIGKVMNWAKARNYRKGDNPIVGIKEGLPKHSRSEVHHAALPYPAIADFVTALRESQSGDGLKYGFEFLILTAARTGEIVGAKLDEFDVKGRSWTVPAARMKAGREHRVPLSDRALEIVKAAGAGRVATDYMFMGRDGKPLSNMAFLMTLRRMKCAVTAHGFRSSFRDWAAETTNFPHAICEAALAHSKAKVVAAYQRGDLFEQRRALMGQWATFCTTPAKAGKVVKMQRSKTAA